MVKWPMGLSGNGFAFPYCEKEMLKFTQEISGLMKSSTAYIFMRPSSASLAGLIYLDIKTITQNLTKGMLKSTQENKRIHEGFYCLNNCASCARHSCRAFFL